MRIYTVKTYETVTHRCRVFQEKFFTKNFCSEAPKPVSQNFVVILSYVVTLNLYIFASHPCVKGDVSDSWQRDCLVDSVL